MELARLHSTDRIRCDAGHTQRWNSVAANRHGIVRRNHSLAAFPPSDCRPALRKDSCALTRSFRFRIPQPPAPRGRTGSGLYARQGGPTQVGPFLFVSGCCWRAVIPRRASWRELRCAIAHLRIHFSARPWIDGFSGAQLRTLARASRARNDEQQLPRCCAYFNAATCTPRRASGPAARGCRPGRRPPRRRRRRASNSRSAPSSFPNVRSSHRP